MNSLPKLILVNGVSSSGRTSLVKEFAKTNPHYFPQYIDEFTETLPQEVWNAYASNDEGWVEIGKRFNHHISSLVESGRCIIADTFYKKPAARDHLFQLINRSEILYIQLYCELEELERREEKRKNRRTGLARSQFQEVYSYIGYDLRIDSTHQTVEDCNQQLTRFINDNLTAAI